MVMQIRMRSSKIRTEGGKPNRVNEKAEESRPKKERLREGNGPVFGGEETGKKPRLSGLNEWSQEDMVDEGILKEHNLQQDLHTEIVE